MPLETLAHTAGVNVKGLILESPEIRQGRMFDLKRDVSEQEFQNFCDFVQRQFESGNGLGDRRNSLTAQAIISLARLQTIYPDRDLPQRPNEIMFHAHSRVSPSGPENKNLDSLAILFPEKEPADYSEDVQKFVESYKPSGSFSVVELNALLLRKLLDPTATLDPETVQQIDDFFSVPKSEVSKVARMLPIRRILLGSRHPLDDAAMRYLLDMSSILRGEEEMFKDYFEIILQLNALHILSSSKAEIRTRGKIDLSFDSVPELKDKVAPLPESRNF